MGREEAQQLRDAIYHRKSVRKYEQGPLPDSALDQIRTQCENLASPVLNARAAFRILTADQVKGLTAKAPYYLAVYAPENPDEQLSAAFALEQASLWMTENGYGSCWFGMVKPKDAQREAEGLPFLIALAFGAPAEPLLREPAQFKRKPLGEITNITDRDSLLEPVRLAPSAVNVQPWYLTEKENLIRLYASRRGLAGKLFGGYTQVDLGIALCHLWIAAVAEDCFGGFVKEEGESAALPGLSYAWSIRLK